MFYFIILKITTQIEWNGVLHFIWGNTLCFWKLSIKSDAAMLRDVNSTKYWLTSILYLVTRWQRRRHKLVQYRIAAFIANFDFYIQFIYFGWCDLVKQSKVVQVLHIQLLYSRSLFKYFYELSSSSMKIAWQSSFGWS